MKDKLTTKINEIIDNILAKDVKDITCDEYCILERKLYSLQNEEEQKRKNGELTAMLAKMVSN